MSAKPLILASALLAMAQAQAADELSCQTTLGRPLVVDSTWREGVLPDPRTIQLEAGAFEAQLGEQATASMTGGVLLRRDDKLAGADSARFDPDRVNSVMGIRTAPQISEKANRPNTKI